MARRRTKTPRRSFPWLTVVFFLSTCALGYVVAVDALNARSGAGNGYEALRPESVARESAPSASDQSEIETLRKRIRELESELVEKEETIEELEAEAGDMRVRLKILESRLSTNAN